MESRDIEVKLKLSKSEYEFVKEFAQQVQLSLEDLEQKQVLQKCLPS